MNAVVIYEECDSARRANALLKRAAERADGTMQWSVKPWRLDLLNWPPLAQEALGDAAEAHLMVLALRGGPELPSGLLEWLEAWAVQRQVPSAALALFAGRSGDTLSPTAMPELSEFAQRHGLSLIVGDLSPWKDESPGVLEDLHEREVAQTPTLLHILSQVTPGYYQHWGINE